MANRFKPAWDKTKSVAKLITTKTKKYSKNFITSSYDSGHDLPTYGAPGMIGGGVFALAFSGITGMTVGLSLVVTPFMAPVALGVMCFTICFNAGYAVSMIKETKKGIQKLAQKTKAVAKNVKSKVSTKTKTIGSKLRTSVQNKWKAVKSVKVSLPTFKKKTSDTSVPTPVDDVDGDTEVPLDTSKTSKGDFDQAVQGQAQNKEQKKTAKPAAKNTPKPK